MKTPKHSIERLLRLQEVRDCPVSEANVDIMSLLELTMTNSAFGYEYALEELTKEEVLGSKLETLQLEVEGFRNSYFEAREHMQRLDPKHLEEFETSLRLEKSVVFMPSAAVH